MSAFRPKWRARKAVIERTAKPFAGSGSARAEAMKSWRRRGEALVAWGYLPIERARDVVTTTYNRAISISLFTLPQNGKHAVKKQEAEKRAPGLQGQARSKDRLHVKHERW